MALLTKEQRLESIAEMLGSARLEGFTPSADYVALLNRYVEGEITLAQVGDITRVKHGVKSA